MGSDSEVQEIMAEAMEKRMKEARESNDTVQQSKQMTRHERSTLAIDQMTRQLKEHAEKGGKEISGEAAHRMIRGIAESAERKVGK